MQIPYIQRLVNLSEEDYLTIQQFARKKGLGNKGFSAALRMIIREWQSYNDQVVVTLRPADPDRSTLQSNR